MRRPSGVYVLTEKIKVDKHRVHVAKVKDGAEPSEIAYIVKLDKTTGTRKYITPAATDRTVVTTL